MQDFLAVANALSDSSRVRLLLSLLGRELCVCSLVELIGLADSTVSKHMSILKQAGLVDARKQGRWVYYRLAGETASPLVRQAIELARKHLHTDPQIVADAARVAELQAHESEAGCPGGASACLPQTAAGALETP